MKNPIFKIRCSAISNIMGENGLTDNQLNKIVELNHKPKLTDKQRETLNDLVYRRDNPELPQGAKTYCEDWLKGQLYDYRKMMSNKYLEKGNIMEDESIDFIAEQLGYGFLIKNEDSFEDEWMRGTADVKLKDLIIDAKNSWSCETFPLFDDKIDPKYYWQLQGYMHGYDKPKAKLIYTLMDTPEHLIEREARYESIRQGFEELESGLYKKYLDNMTYKNVSPKLKIKVYDIERNDDDIQKIKDRVILCRKYIDELLNLVTWHDQ